MTDDVKALVEREKKLISAIISMYHTTRLSDTPFADHIRGKAIVREAFADYREAALTAQAEEIERLRARLEITDEIAERYDGIACRDETIRLLEQKIAALKAAQEVKA